jgi:hypothetical protein
MRPYLEKKKNPQKQGWQRGKSKALSSDANTTKNGRTLSIDRKVSSWHDFQEKIIICKITFIWQTHFCLKCVAVFNLHLCERKIADTTHPSVPGVHQAEVKPSNLNSAHLDGVRIPTNMFYFYNL